MKLPPLKTLIWTLYSDSRSHGFKSFAGEHGSFLSLNALFKGKLHLQINGYTKNHPFNLNPKDPIKFSSTTNNITDQWDERKLKGDRFYQKFVQFTENMFFSHLKPRISFLKETSKFSAFLKPQKHISSILAFQNKGLTHICYCSLTSQKSEDPVVEKRDPLKGGGGNGEQGGDWTTSILLLVLCGTLLYYVFKIVWSK